MYFNYTSNASNYRTAVVSTGGVCHCFCLTCKNIFLSCYAPSTLTGMSHWCESWGWCHSWRNRACNWVMWCNNQELAFQSSWITIFPLPILQPTWLVQPIAYFWLCVHRKVILQPPSGIVLYHWVWVDMRCLCMVPSSLLHRTGDDSIGVVHVGTFWENVLVFI